MPRNEIDFLPFTGIQFVEYFKNRISIVRQYLGNLDVNKQYKKIEQNKCCRTRVLVFCCRYAVLRVVERFALHLAAGAARAAAELPRLQCNTRPRCAVHTASNRVTR